MKKTNPLQAKRQQQRRLVGCFVVVALSGLGYIAYTATVGPQKSINIDRKFSSLHDSYLKGGLTNFLREKKRLKSNVARQLNRGEHASVDAMGIAVYLFPELLEENDFEKEHAEQMWVPQQKAIEENPGSRESRTQFEQLRANIWNYENPDRSEPMLSERAKQVIRIYDLLSQH